MLLPGCARQGATGTTGKVTLVLMESRLPPAWALQLLGGRGSCGAGGCGSHCQPEDDGYPERCGDTRVGPCHCSAPGSSLQCLWAGVQPKGGSPGGCFSFPQLLPANM